MVIHTKTTDGGDHEFKFHVVEEKRELPTSLYS